MKFFFLLFLIGMTTLARAEGPSADNCDFYDEVEQQFQCGPGGYTLSYGKKFCQKYLDVEPQMSLPVQEWFPKVRYCLQKFLADNLDTIHGCEELRQRAITSHIHCYVETGFCGLSVRDEAKVIKLINRDIFNRDFVKTGLKIKEACLKE